MQLKRLSPAVYLKEEKEFGLGRLLANVEYHAPTLLPCYLRMKVNPRPEGFDVSWSDKQMSRVHDERGGF